MTYEYSPETDSRSDGTASGEQSLYGEPRHEDHGDYDEQSLYGEPQHESPDGTDTWDVGLLFGQLQFGPASPDDLGSRTNPSAAESTER